MTEPHGEPTAGEILDERFTLREPVGAVTWKASDARDGGTVAVVLAPDADARYERLLGASRAATVVPAPTALLAGRRSGYVRPWIEGETLDAVCARGGHDDAWIELVRRLCDALASLHRAGVVHGRLCPERVIVPPADDGPFTLLGLDWDRVMPEPAGISVPVSYVSPELVTSRAPTTAADLWGLAMIAFSLATGERHFEFATLTEARSAIAEQPLVAPSERLLRRGVARSIPASFDRWFLACTHRDEGQRYPDVVEARDAFEVLVGRARRIASGTIPVLQPYACLRLAPQVCLSIADDWTLAPGKPPEWPRSADREAPPRDIVATSPNRDTHGASDPTERASERGIGDPARAVAVLLALAALIARLLAHSRC